MNAPVSIREVAAHAGVSVGTVSNVLNRPDIVAWPTREPVHPAVIFQPELEVRRSSQAPVPASAAPRTAPAAG